MSFDFRYEEELDRPRDWRLFLRLWEYARPYKGTIFLSTGLLLITSLLGLAQPYLIKVAIDNHIAAGVYDGLIIIVILFVALLLTEFTLKYFQGYLVQRTGQRAMFDLRLKLFSHIQRLPLKFFDATPVGRVMTRLTNDVENLNEVFSSGLVVIFGDLFLLLGIVVVMVYLNHRLALVTFTIIPILLWVTMIFRSRLRDSHRNLTAIIARINSYVQESLSGMMVTKLFVREVANQRKFTELSREHLRAAFRLTHLYSFYFPLVEVIGSLALALIIWYGGGQIIKGALTFGTLVAFIEYVHRFFNPIRDLSEKYSMMQSAAASAERVFRLLDAPAEEVLPGGRWVEWKGLPITGRVAFEGVWFSYDGREHVLKDVHLSVEDGEMVALVGPTGAGKSSMVSLLARFYEPTRGRITIGGVDIREMKLSQIRKGIGFVFQDPFLFSGDVEGNIRLGNHLLTLEDVVRAAQYSRAHTFISRLPQGYKEPLGERGKTLSMGQRQLLCIARAFAANPKIIILDEATSSVDAETEALIQEGMRELMKGRTSIVIAHRLSTVLAADRIVVLHKGRVVEVGTHQELMRREGIYRKLYEIQFAPQRPLLS